MAVDTDLKVSEEVIHLKFFFYDILYDLLRIKFNYFYTRFRDF